MGQTVKCLPTVWETQVPSLGWEDRLEKEMAAHSCSLAWKIPWIEEPGRLQSTTELDTTEATKQALTHVYIYNSKT